LPLFQVLSFLDSTIHFPYSAATSSSPQIWSLLYPESLNHMHASGQFGFRWSVVGQLGCAPRIPILIFGDPSCLPECSRYYGSSQPILVTLDSCKYLCRTRKIPVTVVASGVSPLNGSRPRIGRRSLVTTLSTFIPLPG
jgi:hypothetical protein